MKWFWPILGMLAVSQAHAVTPKDILDANTPSIVYLEVTDEKGGRIENGTGFIVSHDGYVVTVAHLKPDVGQRLWAVIAQRAGSRYPLDLREIDEDSDVALWQFPQAAVCRPSATISTKGVNVLDRVLVLGFPGNDGLTTASVGINNLSSPEHGFYKADGYLRQGYSGAPAFNEDGQVVAIVQGGTMPGTENNDLIPISLAINLIKKRNVRAGLDTPIAYANNCYSACRHPAHDVESWTTVNPWRDQTGELDGGHNQLGECSKLIAAALTRAPQGSQIELLPGANVPETTGMWEENRKDFYGHAIYKYFCKGTIRSGPIYVMKQSPSCPLKQ